MLPFERREKIIEELRKDVVYIEDLANMLDVSEVTIRRDLKELESSGLITRLHGGAAKLIDTSRETPMDQREVLFAEEKEDIGSYAASLVEDGDTIFIDSGSTNKMMIKYLVNKDINVITNGYRNIEEGLKYDVNMSLIGGDLKKGTLAFVGPITSKILDMYYFDKCFLGVNGIHIEFGLSNADPYESLIKDQVIKRTRHPYIVSDSSKLSSTSVFKFADITDATIITDKITEEFKKLDNIVIAPKN